MTGMFVATFADDSMTCQCAYQKRMLYIDTQICQARIWIHPTRAHLPAARKGRRFHHMGKSWLPWPNEAGVYLVHFSTTLRWYKMHGIFLSFLVYGEIWPCIFWGNNWALYLNL